MDSVMSFVYSCIVCAPSPEMVSLPSLPDLPLLHISSLLSYQDLVSLGQVRPGNQ